MAKTIEFVATSGAVVEAVPHDITYPNQKITIAESSTTAGNMSIFQKTDVSDTFHWAGLADIYVNGVFRKTVLFAPELGVTGEEY